MADPRLAWPPIGGGPLPGLTGIGYEGHSVASLLAALHAARVSRVVDVRLTALSRKPGFSKTPLRDALADAGIGYAHWPDLGNPKANRAGFGGGPDELDTARAAYAEHLAGPGPRAGVDRLVALARGEVVAVLCLEADPYRCHRLVLLHTAWMRAHPTGTDTAAPSAVVLNALERRNPQ